MKKLKNKNPEMFLFFGGGQVQNPEMLSGFNDMINRRNKVKRQSFFLFA